MLYRLDTHSFGPVPFMYWGEDNSWVPSGVTRRALTRDEDHEHYFKPVPARTLGGYKKLSAR